MQYNTKILALCALLSIISIQSSNGAQVTMEIEIGGEEDKCGKYTMKGHDYLQITHARILEYEDTLHSEKKITGNLLCTVAGFNDKERKYYFKCDGEKSPVNIGYIFMISVTARQQMLSGPIDYRYKEDVMRMVDRKFLDPDMLKSQKFDHEQHVYIKDVYIVGMKKEGERERFPLYCDRVFPGCLIADHGLYVIDGVVESDKKKRNHIFRMYYEPFTTNEYIVT